MRSLKLSHFFYYFPIHIATNIPFLQYLFFLENLSSSGECDRYFYEVSFRIDFRRDEGKTFLLEFSREIVDIFFLEEYLPIGGRIDPEFMGEVFVRRDMEIFQNGTTGREAHITSLEITLLRSYTLYFRSRELDSRFVALYDFVIEQGFFIDME